MAKNKKGNVAMTGAIITIVALTAGVTGWMSMKKGITSDNKIIGQNRPLLNVEACYTKIIKRKKWQTQLHYSVCTWMAEAKRLLIVMAISMAPVL